MFGMLYTAQKAAYHVRAGFPGLLVVLPGHRTAMTQKNQNAGEKKAGVTRRGDKKPYQKPGFRFERVFETMALACGKINAVQAQCRFNRKNS